MMDVKASDEQMQDQGQDLYFKNPLKLTKKTWVGCKLQFYFLNCEFIITKCLLWPTNFRYGTVSCFTEK